MFSTIILIILLLWFIPKMVSDSIILKGNDALQELESRNDSTNYNRFVCTCSASDTYYQIAVNKVFEQWDYDDEVIDIRNSLQRALGDDVDISRSMVVRGYLARSNVIVRYDAKNGFATSVMESDRQMIAEREFFVWYDQELRSHGFEHYLMFQSKEYPSRPMRLTDSPPLGCGNYFWEPAMKFRMRWPYGQNISIGMKN